MEMLKKKGYTNVYGIEPSKELINKSSLKARIKVGTAQKINFPDNTFDCVYTMGVLHHLGNEKNTKECFKEVRRVLRPEELFCYNEPYQTFVRWLGKKIIFSPLGKLFHYSRNMRVILEEEKEAISFWTKNADKFERMLYRLGFKKILKHIGLYRVTVRVKKL